MASSTPKGSAAGGSSSGSKRPRAGASQPMPGEHRDVQHSGSGPPALLEQLGHQAHRLLVASTLGDRRVAALQYLKLHESVVSTPGAQPPQVDTRFLDEIVKAAVPSASDANVSTLRKQLAVAAHTSTLPWTQEQLDLLKEAVAQHSAEPPLPQCHAAPRALLDAAAQLLPLQSESCVTPTSPKSNARTPFCVSPPRSESAATDGHWRRLEVVLDIDHTLLHATEAPQGGARPPTGTYQFRLLLPNGAEMRYWVQPREGLLAFLRELQQLAIIHVYTMASKSYTRHVLNAMDPDCSIVGGRVLCREDGQGAVFQKSLEHLLEPDASAGSEGEGSQSPLDAMIVVDDREDAWDTASKPKVLQIRPFRAFSSHGVPMLAAAAVDTALMDVLRVLREVHAMWTSGEVSSAGDALALCKKQVLQGVELVLSGGLLQDAEQPQRCLYWRLAEAFGARCHLVWTSKENVTHVVSKMAFTHSVKRALETETVHAVSAEWLLNSCSRWCRQCEDAYTLRPTGPTELRAAAPATSLPVNVEESLRSITGLIPSSADDSEKVQAAIKYLLPLRIHHEADRLFRQFVEHSQDDSEEGQANKARVLLEITELVGRDTLRVIMASLGML